MSANEPAKAPAMKELKRMEAELGEEEGLCEDTNALVEEEEEGEEEEEEEVDVWFRRRA